MIRYSVTYGGWGRGDVGDLTALHARHRRAGQLAPAVRAAVHVAEQGLVRVVDQRHRRPTGSGLLSRLSARRGARRATFRLAVGRVRRGRLRGGRRVRAQPPLQLLDPRHLRGQLCRQGRDLPGQCLDLHRLGVDHLTQYRVGLPQSGDHVRISERRRLRPGRPAMITEPQRRSSRHAHNRPDRRTRSSPRVLNSLHRLQHSDGEVPPVRGNAHRTGVHSVRHPDEAAAQSGCGSSPSGLGR